MVQILHTAAISLRSCLIHSPEVASGRICLKWAVFVTPLCATEVEEDFQLQPKCQEQDSEAACAPEWTLQSCVHHSCREMKMLHPRPYWYGGMSSAPQFSVSLQWQNKDVPAMQEGFTTEGFLPRSTLLHYI